MTLKEQYPTYEAYVESITTLHPDGTPWTRGQYEQQVDREARVATIAAQITDYQRYVDRAITETAGMDDWDREFVISAILKDMRRAHDAICEANRTDIELFSAHLAAHKAAAAAIKATGKAAPADTAASVRLAACLSHGQEESDYWAEG